VGTVPHRIGNAHPVLPKQPKICDRAQDQMSSACRPPRS
jgi:hypothetical protein